MKVIGLAGRKGSGKDTVAKLLGGTRIALADWMKRFSMKIFEFSEEDVFGPSENRTNVYSYSSWEWTKILINAGRRYRDFERLFPDGMAEKVYLAYVTFFQTFLSSEGEGVVRTTPREVLQLMGTELGRTLWKDVWANEVRRMLMLCSSELAVISDVRFPNEVEMVHSLGGKVFWVDASKRIPPSGDLHASETSLTAEGCDEVIDNNGSLEDLVLP